MSIEEEYSCPICGFEAPFEHWRCNDCWKTDRKVPDKPKPPKKPKEPCIASFLDLRFMVKK